MNNIKVTQLSIKEAKKKIFDNDTVIENVYLLAEEDDGLNLRPIKYCRLDKIIKYMSDGSAFLEIKEGIKNDDRTEE
jgi:hypothetical protein